MLYCEADRHPKPYRVTLATVLMRGRQLYRSKFWLRLKLALDIGHSGNQQSLTMRQGFLGLRNRKLTQMPF
jgi:hypothetical protein